MTSLLVREYILTINQSVDSASTEHRPVHKTMSRGRGRHGLSHMATAQNKYY